MWTNLLLLHAAGDRREAAAMTEEHRNEQGTEFGVDRSEAPGAGGAEGRPDPAGGEVEDGEGVWGDGGAIWTDRWD